MQCTAFLASARELWRSEATYEACEYKKPKSTSVLVENDYNNPWKADRAELTVPAYVRNDVKLYQAKPFPCWREIRATVQT